MSKIIEEAAKAYAADRPRCRFGIQRAFTDGANFALSHQWRSVEDELPEIDEEVLVYIPNGYTPYDALSPKYYAVAYYDGEDWYTTDEEHIRPTYYMNIPELKTEEK